MENQRIRVTKAMLKEALITLLEEKNIGKITIYELCDRAEVNRTTFYKYYGSQFDLLADIEKDIFNEVERILETVTSNEEGSLDILLGYLEKERRKFLVFIQATPDRDFAEQLFTQPSILAQLQAVSPNKAGTPEEVYTRQFFCQGVYAIIGQWLGKEEREPRVDISVLIISLAKRVFGDFR